MTIELPPILKLFYEVISMSETIQTKMGKFKNCLKIKGIGKTYLSVIVKLDQLE